MVGMGFMIWISFHGFKSHILFFCYWNLNLGRMLLVGFWCRLNVTMTSTRSLTASKWIILHVWYFSKTCDWTSAEVSEVEQGCQDYLVDFHANDVGRCEAFCEPQLSCSYFMRNGLEMDFLSSGNTALQCDLWVCLSGMLGMWRKSSLNSNEWHHGTRASKWS